jgi:hypothetical protein
VPEATLETPVVLLIFNRPDTTQKVIDAIRSARPRQLFVVGDGPRPDRPDDGPRCAAAQACLDGIDWPCELVTNLSPVNLGCRRRVSSGLGWAFRHVDEAIVLEDDCVPDPTFFGYCRELLERYRDDERVMVISGNDFLSGRRPDPHSYGFSRYPLIWGWATWRRAWRHYDVDIKEWPRLRRLGWLESFLSPRAAQYWSHCFQRVYDGFDTWDYSLVFACWRQGGLAIHPRWNLVTNIGFRSDATHTRDEPSFFANMPARTMRTPLSHPDRIERDDQADREIEDLLFSGTFVRTFSTIRALMRAESLGAPGPPASGVAQKAAPSR